MCLHSLRRDDILLAATRTDVAEYESLEPDCDFHFARIAIRADNTGIQYSIDFRTDPDSYFLIFRTKLYARNGPEELVLAS